MNEHENAGSRTISLGELFRGFSVIGLSGFGGVLPWAHRLIVEQRRWLTGAEFSSTLGFCQVLPGPNVVNLAVVVGARFQGRRGAIVAPCGLMFGPLLIVLALAALYTRYGELAPVQAMLRGVSAVGAGLIIATGIKMASVLRSGIASLLVVALTFVAIAVMRLPLLAVMLVLAPVAVAVAARAYKEP